MQPTKPQQRFSVRKRDAKKVVKIVRDRETYTTLERVKAIRDRGCYSELCSYFMSRISKGQEYARVLNPDLQGPFVRGQRMAVYEDFHFDCVPERAQPLLEYYRSKL